MSLSLSYPVLGVPTYANFASLPALASDGATAITLDTDTLYIFNLGTLTWLAVGGSGTVLSVGTIDSQPKSANGAVINSNQLIMQTADTSFPGLLTTGTQSIAGAKTFTGAISASNLSGTNTGDVMLSAVGSSPNANAATLTGQVLNLQPFDSTNPGVVPLSGGGSTNFLRADGTWAAPAGTGANTALSNLTNPTAINQHLIPNNNVSPSSRHDLGTGSSTTAWRNLFLSGSLKDTNSVNVVVPSGRSLVDDAGINAVAFASTNPGRGLLDGSGLNAVLWGNRQLIDEIGTTVQLSWSSSGVKFDQLTPSTVPYLNASSILTSSAVTPIELGYVSGVTSSIQTQLNGKQATGNYITALTGDATATGPGSVALTLATVNANVGSFGSSTAIPSFTVNAKGLITAASTNAVIAPAGTLTGTTLASNVVTSSLTTVGTIGTGTWAGTAISETHGGTNQTSYTTGDTLYASATNTLSKLAKGTTGQFLKQGASIPSWASFVAPTIQQFTSGSGTYTTPAGVLYIVVEAIGAGGGGAGAPGGTTPGNGGNSTFGSSLISAGGGFGATAGAGADAGAGGTASLGGLPGLAQPGNYGIPGNNVANISAGGGGVGPFGGGSQAPTGPDNSVGGNGAANTGAGGAGASGGVSAGPSGGGGSGAYVKGFITSPSATYSYAVGAGGAGGVSTTNGGSGGSGLITVYEYYQ